MSQIELAPQAPTIEAQSPLAATGIAMQEFAGRIGASFRNGIEAVREAPHSIKTLAAVGTTALALFGASQAEAANAGFESVAPGNTPTLTGAETLPGTPTASPGRPNINSYKMGVGKAVEVSNGIHYLDNAATEASASETTATTESTTSGVELLKQTCIDAALVKPEILKAQLQHTGNFDRVPLQAYTLSTQSELWPDECRDLYSHGLQARGQAFHNGHWVNMNYWGGISIFPDTGKGYWPGYIGNLDNLRFPVCRTRIQLKANIVDLSVDMNMNTPWKQHHPTIAKKQLGSIPADILPRKPKACN